MQSPADGEKEGVLKVPCRSLHTQDKAAFESDTFPDESKERGSQRGGLQSPRAVYVLQMLPSIQPVPEEEEESSVEGDAQSNNDGVKEGNNTPRMLNAQTVIQHMLDELCHGLIPKDLTLPTPSDHALDLIHN
jgi:hypothetical protein